jgi:Proprotein convertase P-domain
MPTKYLSSLAVGFGLVFSVVMPANALTSSFSTGAIVDDASTTFTTGTTASGTPTSLFLVLTHNSLSDLEIYLTSPSGDILNIAASLNSAVGGSINATILDSAVAAIDTGSDPYNGDFQPTADESASDPIAPGFLFALDPTVFSFAAFGVQEEGEYTLTIADLVPDNDGNLISASVEVIPIPFEFSPAIGLGALGVAFALKKLISKTKK